MSFRVFFVRRSLVHFELDCSDHHRRSFSVSNLLQYYNTAVEFFLVPWMVILQRERVSVNPLFAFSVTDTVRVFRGPPSSSPYLGPSMEGPAMKTSPVCVARTIIHGRKKTRHYYTLYCIARIYLHIYTCIYMAEQSIHQTTINRKCPPRTGEGRRRKKKTVCKHVENIQKTNELHID